jgi:hypothetical protein
MENNVPFVANTSDDLHCLQAAYMSILKYFEPEIEMPWDEWCELTGFEKDKGTWASASLLWFKSQGFDVIHMSLFDYEDFVKNGGNYLLRLTGEEVGNWQIAHTNMPIEIERAKKLLAEGIIQKREPQIEDIKELLTDGYLVRVLVNSNKLNQKPGYFAHAVTIIGFNDNEVIFHDPGLPPIPERHLNWPDFEAAWADPNNESKELDAIRLAT